VDEAEPIICDHSERYDVGGEPDQQSMLRILAAFMHYCDGYDIRFKERSSLRGNITKWRRP
jgi:hypothetical protein